MATKNYQVKAPDGSIVSFVGPEDATKQQIKAAAERAYKARASEPAAQPVGQESPVGVIADRESMYPSGRSTVTGMTANEAQSRGEAGLESLEKATKGTAKFTATTGADMAIEGGLATAGQLAGVPFAPITGGASIAAGGAAGGYVGNYLAQMRQIAMGEREEFSKPEAYASAVASMVPGGPFAKGVKRGVTGNIPTVVKRSIANEASRDVGANVAAEGTRQYLNAEDFDINKLGIAAGVGLAGTAVSRYTDQGKRITKKTKREIQNTEKRITFDAAAEAGYKIPPSSLDEAGSVNSALEYIAGQPLTLEEIRKSNQMVTNALARKAIGLPDDEVLNLGALKAVRESAGEVYGEVAAVSPKMDDALIEFRKARDNARAFWKENDRTGTVKSQNKAKKFDALAETHKKRIEDTLRGRPGGEELLARWEKARITIAKTHVIEDAFNVGSGNVRADIISRRRRGGHYPTTGELEVIDRFAEAFEKSSKSIGEGAASGISHPLLMIGASTAAFAGGNSVGGVPGGIAAMSGVLFAPKLVREAITSDVYQNLMTARRYGVPVTQDFLSSTAKYGTMAQGRDKDVKLPAVSKLLERAGYDGY